MNVMSRIDAIRRCMKQNKVDGYLILGTDPHLSEYVPDTWKTRQWISGFTGSYGKVAITQNEAVLWTDSRYFLQAETQLEGTEIKLLKDRQPDTISAEDWFTDHLLRESTVAIDGITISATEAKLFKEKLSVKGIKLILNCDILTIVWENRPKLPDQPIVDFHVKYAGISRHEKIALIRKELVKKNCNATILCQLDELAWCFNLRGSDIQYNPLFIGYGLITLEKVVLFLNSHMLSMSLKEELGHIGVEIMIYNSVLSYLNELGPLNWYLDPEHTNSVIYNSISCNLEIDHGLSIATLLKSVKNDIEVLGMKNAHIRDGAAVVNFLYWFSQKIGKEKITELTVDEKLKEFRSEQDFFAGESFPSIVGFGAHGAIVHYLVTPESDVEVTKDNILLFDSGGHYFDGTTDITRTISTGKVTQQQRSDFTLVLKGNIALANTIFPENTKGYSLDSFARKALWDNGLDYGHGTGHGVGHYLSVHEGPMAIRKEFNNQPVRIGQVITDEPGLYRVGEYGIRTENVLLCTEYCSSEFGRFLNFSTLTLCPLDRNLIDESLLIGSEITWINQYHERVLIELSPLLKPEVREWLTIQCEPLNNALK